MGSALVGARILERYGIGPTAYRTGDQTRALYGLRTLCRIPRPAGHPVSWKHWETFSGTGQWLIRGTLHPRA
jgi:hypothetical protein